MAQVLNFYYMYFELEQLKPGQNQGWSNSDSEI